MTGDFNDKSNDFEDEYEQELRELEEAKNNLMSRIGPKAVMYMIDKKRPLELMLLRAEKSINVRSYFEIKQISRGKINKWLYAFECEATQKQAEKLNHIINNTQIYSDKEVEVMVTEEVPFDIRGLND